VIGSGELDPLPLPPLPLSLLPLSDGGGLLLSRLGGGLLSVGGGLLLVGGVGLLLGGGGVGRVALASAGHVLVVVHYVEFLEKHSDLYCN
jgi:hypothetical protein